MPEEHFGAANVASKDADDNTLLTVAAHIANRCAGANGRENMSDAMLMFLNVVLLSKSLNMGNIGWLKDSRYGLPAGLKGQMLEASSGKSADIGMSYAKRVAGATNSPKVFPDNRSASGRIDDPSATAEKH